MHLSSQSATVTKSSTQVLQEGKKNHSRTGDGVTIAKKKLILAVPLSQGVALADHSTRLVYTRCPS